MVCAFYAFGHLKSEDVVTLCNTFPLWVAILSWPLYGHSPGVPTIVAILTGLVGVVLVEQPQIESGNWGVMAALASALFSAVAMLGLNRLRDIDPRSVVVHFSAVATVFCLAAFFTTPRAQPVERVLEPTVLLMLVGMGVSATIGQVFLTLAFGRGAPARVSVVGLMADCLRDGAEYGDIQASAQHARDCGNDPGDCPDSLVAGPIEGDERLAKGIAAGIISLTLLCTADEPSADETGTQTPRGNRSGEHPPPALRAAFAAVTTRPPVHHFRFLRSSLSRRGCPLGWPLV